MTAENQIPNLQNTREELEPPPPTSKRKRHWAVSLLRIMGLSYGTVLVMLVVMESKLVFPGAYDDRQSSSGSALSQPWDYPAQDGTTITGRLLDRPGCDRTVLFFHGNGVKASLLDDWIARLGRRLDANVLAAEYRGFQDENTTPNETNLIEDSLAAHDAICLHYDLPPQDLILYGRSLGGGCAAAVAAQRDTKTLILDRTFDSVVNVAADRFPIFPIRWLMRNQFDSIEQLRHFKGRLIQIHGTTDEIVPITHGKRLHESITAAIKIFIEVPGMRHNDPMPGKTLDEIRRLISLNRSN